MTAEERVAKLEQTVRDFNLTLLGTDQIHGGFPELEPKTVLEERLQQLEAAHEKFEIRGGHNANVEGSLKTGYAVNMKCGAQAATGGPIPPTPPPPPSCETQIELVITELTACNCASVGDGTSISFFLDSFNHCTLLPTTPGMEPDCLWMKSPGDCVDVLDINYWSDTDCVDYVDTSPVYVGYAAARVSGMWHMVAWSTAITPSYVVLFYAVTSDISGVIPNQIECGGYNSITITDDPLIDFLFGLPWTATPGAFGGLGSITLL